MSGFLFLLLLGLVWAAFHFRRQIADLERDIHFLQEEVLRLSRELNRQVLTKGAPPAEGEARAPAPRPVAQTPPATAPPPAVPPRPVVPPSERTFTPPPVVPPVKPPPSSSPSRTPSSIPSSIPSSTPRRPPSPPKPPFDWEQLVGVRLFSAIAGLALVVAAIFFLKYSIEHGWLRPEIRVAIGIAVGVALLIACELKVARDYPITANAMDAAAVGILFATFFSAHALWHLIGVLPAFGLLFMVAALAVLLSIRRDSMFIALLGLVGGFAAPALLSTGENRPFGLFGYLLILNAGLAWVAQRKKWPLLNGLSLAFTVFYQWGWVTKFLDAGQVPIGAGVFLIFPMLTYVTLAIAPGEAKPEEKWTDLFRNVPAVSAALPLLFAGYLAAVPAYGARFGLLFGFQLVVVIGLFAVAATRGPALLHALGGLSAIVVWMIWLSKSYTGSAWPVVLAWLAAFVLFFLAAPLVAGRSFITARWPRSREGFAGVARYAVYAAPLLLSAIPIIILQEARAESPGLVFTVLLFLLAACAWYAIARGEGGVHFVAAFFALAAEGIWSAQSLTPERLLPALAVYGVFGLFYIGVPIAARRRGTPLTPQGAGAVLALVSIGLLFFMAFGVATAAALWGMALLLAILNLGLFAEASVSRMPALSIVGVVLSWLVLGVWWSAAALAAVMLPALVVVGGFSMLALAGNVWARRRAQPADAAGFDRGIYLGLIGHLFVLFVATRLELSVPPWPLLGVLFVLDLAIATASLALRRGELHLAASVVSLIIIMVWVQASRVTPWPQVAIIASAGVVALAFLWLPLAMRVRAKMDMFELAAGLAALLAQLVAVVAASQTGSPALPFLVAAQVAFVIAALVIAARPAWGLLALAAVVPAALAVLGWASNHNLPVYWRDQLYFAAPVYAVFLVYPEWRRLRGTVSHHAYLAAVLASAVFFMAARDAMRLGGLQFMIGALPVAQALLLAGLLVGIIRSTPAKGPPSGTIALVAGAALAFVTIAIPLQLDKHWITVGWALEGAALAWLYTRVPHRGLLLGTAGLLAAVFIRLALNPAVLTYEPRGELRIWNWYLYTYLLAAAAFFVAAHLLRNADTRLNPELPPLTMVLPAGATILLFLLLNIEIADFYATGSRITFEFSAGIAQDLTYTLGWAAFSVAMLAVGIMRHNKAARGAAVLLLTATVFKAFLHDLWKLGGLYRVGSLVGLAVCLSLVALALQRFVLTPSKRAE